MHSRMRRGRSWRGGGNFRGGGSGHNSRGFMSSGPPRLNRPPWPRGPPLLPLLRPSGDYYGENRFDDDNFESHNYQNSPQKSSHHGFQRGDRHQFQRGRPEHRQDQNRPAFEPSSRNFSKPPPRPWENPPPILQQGAHNQHDSHTKFGSGVDSGSESQRIASEPNQDQQGGKHDTNFNKALKSLHKVLDYESKDFEEDSQEHEQGPDNRPERQHHFQNDDFHSNTSNPINFPRGPGNFMRGRNFAFPKAAEFHPNTQNPYKFDHRSQNNEQVDFSKPPPFHLTRSSQDYGSKGYEYNMQRERSLSFEADRAIASARTPLLTNPDYSGQRPPATDHYIESSGGGDGSFHKSIGDTVDLIKKRLQDRQENPDQHRRSVDSDPKLWSGSDSPDKLERSQRRRSYKDKSSHKSKSDRIDKKCSKMKRRIIRELFKMDKKSLHKLVDDPQSSTKFEFALNSLITESRNSLNRQMRAAAEKSLSGSSSRLDRFGKDDTVYEDTFMTQMQGVLDANDILMLSDIKPMVMAEINKVLQLDEYGQQSLSDEERYHSAMSHRDSYDSESKEHKYEQQYNDPFDMPQEVKTEALVYVKEESMEEGIYISEEEEPPPKLSRRRHSSHKRHDSHRSHEPIFPNDDMRPKFPDNLDSISDDDEDPFAELDKQYHVAVEYNMMDHAERSPTPQRPQPLDTFNNNQNSQSANVPSILDVPSNKSKYIHEDILKIATDEKLPSNIVTTIMKEAQSGKGQECAKESTEMASLKGKSEKPGHDIVKKEIKTENKEKSLTKAKTHVKSENTKLIEKESVHPVARKREVNDKISHRKEKHKKCDPEKSDTNKKVLNKNIIINVNDCASKSSEKCETGPKFLNVFIEQGNADELREDSKKSDSTVNISYSDKYVKRKQVPKKNEKDKKPDKKKDNNCPPTGKTEKLKLQPIDIFDQTQRKPSSHTALRNTALASPESKPTEQIEHVAKTPAPIIVKKSNMKMIKPARTLTTNATQTVVKVNTRFTQTTKKMISTACQTDSSPNEQDKQKNMETTKPEDVMDRMKQIDLEIQQLIQEKFKLYKNLENAEPTENMQQSVCAPIVNVNAESADENKMLETFAQMSEEELQDIALQGLQDSVICLDTETDNPPKSKRVRKKGVANKDLAKVTKARKRNVPKVVLKLNRSSSSLDCSESHDEYEVVKSPKKLKKVTFEDTPQFCKESRYKRAVKSNLPSFGSLLSDESLDKSDSEFTITPSPIKANKKTPKKQLTKKQLENLKRTVRPCFVRLTRLVFSTNLLEQAAAMSFEDYETKNIQNLVETTLRPAETVSEGYSKPIDVEFEENTTESDSNPGQEEEIAEISGIRLQDDMLDVSEDIIIDGNCDLDKPMEATPTIDEDCSVVDNGTPQEVPNDAEATAGGCKLYDYSPNGEYGTEMVSVCGHGDAIVAIECVNNNFLAASIDGNVYHYNGRDGQLLTTLRGSTLPLTCLNIKEDKYSTTVYTGSLDSRIRYYDLDTGMEKGPECNVLSPIQSMDRAWDTIFVGTRTGFVLQFECKNNLLIPVSTLKFSEQAILAIRAMKEGPRKVLLIASRSDQITIKDAQTGLLLRTLDGPKMTVYSLLFEEGRVYCGTSNNHIQVFDFTSGTSMGSYTSGKGVVCLRAAGGLLLAGCYDGCVYIYRGGREPVAQLRGPTDMLLSLAVLNSKIIASYKDRSLFMWKIPANLIQEMIL